jgi:hypothetical protein
MGMVDSFKGVDIIEAGRPFLAEFPLQNRTLLNALYNYNA